MFLDQVNLIFLIWFMIHQIYLGSGTADFLFCIPLFIIIVCFLKQLNYLKQFNKFGCSWLYNFTVFITVCIHLPYVSCLLS